MDKSENNISEKISLLKSVTINKLRSLNIILSDESIHKIVNSHKIVKLSGQYFYLGDCEKIKLSGFGDNSFFQLVELFSDIPPAQYIQQMNSISGDYKISTKKYNYIRKPKREVLLKNPLTMPNNQNSIYQRTSLLENSAMNFFMKIDVKITDDKIDKMLFDKALRMERSGRIYFINGSQKIYAERFGIVRFKVLLKLFSIKNPDEYITSIKDPKIIHSVKKIRNNVHVILDPLTSIKRTNVANSLI